MRCLSVPFTTSSPISSRGFHSHQEAGDPAPSPGLLIQYVHRPRNTPLHVARGSVPNGTSHLLPETLLFFPFSSPGGNNVFTRCLRNQGNCLSHSFPDPSHPTRPQVLSIPLLLSHSVSSTARIFVCISFRLASLTLAVTPSIHPAIREPSQLRKSTNLMMLSFS